MFEGVKKKKKKSNSIEVGKLSNTTDPNERTELAQKGVWGLPISNKGDFIQTQVGVQGPDHPHLPCLRLLTV